MSYPQMKPSRFVLIGDKYTIPKDPGSNLDYGIRLQAWLVGNDSLTNAMNGVAGYAPVWTLSDGLVKVSEGVVNDPTFGWTAWIKLQAGALGKLESAICHWKTDQGREEEQTLWFNMVDK